MNLTPQQIFNESSLTTRAVQAVKDSLDYYHHTEQELSAKDFADEALSFFEKNNAPIEVLDELYLESTQQ